MSEAIAQDKEAGWPWKASWPLALLTLIAVFNYLDRALLGLALPLVKREFGASDTVLGLVTGVAFVLLYSVLGVPIAWLADRYNRRNIITFGLAFWSLMTALTGFVGSVWQLAMARFLMGAGEACAMPPSNSIIADLVPPRRRPLAMAIFGTANSLAFIIFFPIAGWVAQHYGWRAMFLAMGAPGLMVALLFIATVREPARQSHGGDAARPRGGEMTGGAMTGGAILGDVADLFRNRWFGWVFLGVTLMGANVWAAGAWTPTFFARVHHMGLAEVAGTVGPVRGFVGAAGVLAGGFLIDRLPAHRDSWRMAIPAIACILAGPAEALFLLGDARALWLSGFVATSFLSLIHQGPIYAATMNVVRPGQRALAISVILFGASFLGNVVGPSAVGLLNDRLAAEYGPLAVRYSMLIIAVTPVLAGLCFLRAAFLPSEAARPRAMPYPSRQ
ncbi:MFS transporter [Novosphingobium sp. SG707]|uniref:spinster family MFS transporter n=1 Tax=Novosphingobium sp. SG707 TaxID=2586996 RepID=UPI001446DFC1|nr:MFS transporter [Novosphingobium sp. SG707]NKI98384.1 MFS family permease [Novosphingobium sp. SG707]